MNRFCIKCGEETNDLIKSLCTSCFQKSNSVLTLPKRISIDFDKRTGKIMLGRDWLETNQENVELVISQLLEKDAEIKGLKLSGIRVDFANTNFFEIKSVKTTVSFDVVVEGVKVPYSIETLIVFHKSISDASMKIASNYHEAIIQVRFTEKVSPEKENLMLNDVLTSLKIMKKNNELAEAVDVIKERGGYDVLIGSNKAAKTLARTVSKKHSAEMTYSNTLLGQDRHGKTTYRHSYCIRF